MRLDEQVGQRVDDLGRVQPPFHPDGHAFPAALIQDVRSPEYLPIIRVVVHEVIGPDMVAKLWPQPNARSIVQPEPPFLRLFHWYFEPFAPPQTLNTFVVHSLRKACVRGGHPASLSNAATRRYPYRPYWRVSSIMSATRHASSARPTDNRFSVDRCCPRTQQARRSEIWNWLRTWSMPFSPRSIHAYGR